jgi:hypothetical protein
VKSFSIPDVYRFTEGGCPPNILRQLRHPNVIGIHGQGFADPDNQRRPDLVLEYFAGDSLKACK